MTTRGLLLLGLGAPTLLGLSAQAATITSAGSGDYNTGATWVDSSVPGTLDDAVITDGHALTSSSSIVIGLSGTVSVNNGSFTGDELNLGWVPPTSGTVTNELNIGSQGSVTLSSILWLYDRSLGISGANGKSTVNFSGAGGSLTLNFGSGGSARVSYISGSNTFSELSFEQLWDAGILTLDGKSGLTNDEFVDNFTVSNVNETGDTITAVPEPGSLALLGLGGLCVLQRRRK